MDDTRKAMDDERQKVKAKLIYIKLQNFKSFKGEHRFNLGYKNFSAIIGPNGSGKSNIMDAISFVSGERPNSLRVKSPSDLIYGANVNQPAKDPTYVKAAFKLTDSEADENVIKFTRAVKSLGYTYQINKKVVTSEEYSSELVKIGINVKAKNFLVYQGAVENLSLKTRKELTSLFEEVSGSIAFKAAYEKCKVELAAAEADLALSTQKKRNLAAGVAEARVEKEEQNTFKKQYHQLEKLKTRLSLFKLFQCENEIKSSRKEADKLRQNIDQNDQNKAQMENNDLPEKEQLRENVKTRLTKTKQDMKKVEEEKKERSTSKAKAEETERHAKKKLEMSKMSLLKAKKAESDHIDEVKDDVNKKNEAEERKKSFERVLQSDANRVLLDEETNAEYLRLKKEVGLKSAHLIQALNEVKKDQKKNKDDLENLVRQSNEIRFSLKQKQERLLVAKQKLVKLNHSISAAEDSLGEEQKRHEELGKDVESADGRLQKLEDQLKKVSKDLDRAQFNRYQTIARTKKMELEETLKFLFTPSKVFGRISSLCHPVSERYEIAVTRVLEKKMDFIVVDTVETAQNCIEYLKTHKLKPETFLPMDSLSVSEFRKALRERLNKRQAKFVIDVLEYEDNLPVKRAMQYVTNNVLLGETLEDARGLANDLIVNERFDAVSLDGTLFNKNGSISSGSWESLSRKSSQWNEKSLKSNELKLQEELREVNSIARKKPELEKLGLNIKGLEKRLTSARVERLKTIHEIDRLQIDIANLDREASEMSTKVDELEAQMKAGKGEVMEVRKNMNHIEDKIFKEFCDRCEVKDIREFEQINIRARNTMKKELLLLEQNLNTISTLVQFQQSRTAQITENVKRWEIAVKKDEEKLEQARECLAEKIKDYEATMRKLQNVKNQQKEILEEQNTLDEEIAKIRHEIKEKVKKFQVLQMSLLCLRGEIEKLRSQRHDILQQCKMANTILPMEKGCMDDIVMQELTTSANTEAQRERGSQTSSDSVGGSSATLPNSQIVYDQEERIVMDYSKLGAKYKSKDEDWAILQQDLERRIDELYNEINLKVADNLPIADNFDLVYEKLRETNRVHDELVKKVGKCRKEFEKVKHERLTAFMTCYDHVSKKIENVYKDLTQGPSATALLTLSDMEEPFNGDMQYCCIIPGKPCCPMSSFSGGEKTLSSLSLLFSLRSYNPAPFFVLDEVDAALDDANICKVAEYIKEHQKSLHIIVISLKDIFYKHADSLIGVCPFESLRSGERLRSKTLHLDLVNYFE